VDAALLGPFGNGLVRPGGNLKKRGHFGLFWPPKLKKMGVGVAAWCTQALSCMV